MSKPYPPTPPPGALPESARADIKAWLDGELSPLRRLYVGWRISQDPALRAERDELARLGGEMKKLNHPTPRPELRARILANLPPAPPTPLPPARRVLHPSQLALSGSLACALLVALLLGAQSGWWQTPAASPLQGHEHRFAPGLYAGTRSHSTNPSSDTNSTFSHDSTSFTPHAPFHDPTGTSEEADRIAAQRLNEWQTQRQQELARQKKAQRLLAEAKKAQAERLRPVEATLTVADVAATQVELTTLTTRLSGRVLAATSQPPDVPEGSASVASTDVSAPVIMPAAATETTVAFEVPVTQADALRHKLRALGALPVVAKAPVRQSAVASALPADSGDANRTETNQRTGAGHITRENAGDLHPARMRTMTDTADTALVRFTVHLRPTVSHTSSK